MLKYFYTVLKIVTAMNSFMSTHPPFQLPWTACQTSLLICLYNPITKALMSSRAKCFHDPTLALGQHVLNLLRLVPVRPQKSYFPDIMISFFFSGNLDSWPVPLYLALRNSRSLLCPHMLLSSCDFLK